MTESFWYLTGEDGPESDAERPDLSGTPFDARDAFAPYQESMRGDRSRPQRAPSTDQKRVRRQIHRSGAHAYEEVDWNQIHPQLKHHADNGELHRGIGVNLPDELHDFVHDPTKPRHERAVALLNHLVGQRTDGDHRYGLGMHWSLDESAAQDFGHKVAEHLAEENQRQGRTDLRYGHTPGEVHTDYDDITEHLHERHGIHPEDQPDGEKLIGLHQHLHAPEPPMKGQQELFDASPYRDTKHLEMGPTVRQDPAEPHAKPGTSVIFHTPIPDIEDIEHDPYSSSSRGGEVYHPFGHGEREVPVRAGASIPITGISWNHIRPWDEEEEGHDPYTYTHHRFDEPEYREARKHATVLNTQVERLNKGDQIRTPTGQTSEVKRLRPHETDSTLMYLDTDMGTSTVKRGTDFQVVPRNSQQQELPDIGNPMGGNSGKLPGAGQTPGGAAGNTSASPPGTCPNCGNVGTLHVQGSNYICSVCGFTVPAGGSPGNLMFTNQPSGHIPARRKPGEIPRAHVWASKYQTFDEGCQIARRARRVSGGDQ